ncbi:MAG: DUF302 domain-containing protein [Candidatus Gracilibacteria bacterium]|nr:DUF302 domain-containing protein [Candidatus Gracilibacteria bacterium]
MTYTYIKKSPFGFDETLDELRISFSEIGFGVVSNVAISEKIKAKVDGNFPKYTTLGFCKPELAYEYLSEDINLGIFMPCSISVYEKGGEIFISAGLPEIVIDRVINNDKISKHSKEISEIMKKVIDSI